MRICGQEFSLNILERVREVVAAEPEISRRSLSRRVCQWLDWRSDSGEWQEGGCRNALAQLDRRQVLELTAPRATFAPRGTPDVAVEGSEVHATLDALGEVALVAIGEHRSHEAQVWRALMDRHHYLGEQRLCGAQLRYLIRSERYGWLGALGFNSASWALHDRDAYIGWDEAARRENLRLVVANSRFLILPGVQVVELFLEAIAPAQITLAMQVVDNVRAEKQALQQQWEQQLSQARYEAQLAQRQYDAVDPDNRLVAATLERRWNEKLEAVQDLEQAYQAARAQEHFSLSAEEQSDIRRLAQDLPAIWHAPSTTVQERKQLLRYLIAEVQLDGVSNQGKIDIRVTWRSGAVSIRQIERVKVGAWAPRTADQVIERIRDVAPLHTVAEITELLNQEGLRSAHGRAFREHHVLYLARRHKIEVTTSARLLRRSAH